LLRQNCAGLAIALRIRDAGHSAQLVAADASIMIARGSDELKAGLTDYLARLWRYGLVLSKNRDVAEDLVRKTCVRALEDSQEFSSGSRLDRRLFSILRSTWWNEVCSHGNQEGALDAESASILDEAVESDALAHPILKEVLNLGDAQREALFLVYVEGLTYRQAAAMLEVPIGTIVTRLAMARERLATHTVGLATQPSTEARSE
jgi:RNA polymerase sigma-70 factor (ECF subfamily)